MQRSSQTPPPLYYSPSSSDKGRESSTTSDNTPLHTPTVAEAPWPPPFGPAGRKEKDLYFSWHKKQEAATNQNANPILGGDWQFESDLADPLFEDDDDAGDSANIPLFPDAQSPPAFPKRTMGTAAPIDISLPQRLSASQSPSNQTSNLTSALREAGAMGQQPSDFSNPQAMGIPDPGRLSVSGRHDSISNMFGSSYYGGSGARPISMKDRQRRESTTGGGSFMGGMSWGGISVGSLRDDIMMTGTSPMPFGRSPSLHSSSYLPKMEAQFLSGYQCCGKNLDTLHDLLQHFEENHAQQSQQLAHRSSISSQNGYAGNRRPSNGAGPSQQNITPADQRAMNQPRQNSFAGSREGFNRTQLSTVQDMDTLHDMEMDDAATPATPVPQMSSTVNQNNQGIQPIKTNMAPAVPAQQAFRTSTPTTPNANSAFQLYSNPTVSSVNTPAMSTQALQQSTTSPHTSIPGTPAGEMDPAFGTDYMSGFGMGGMNMNMNLQGQSMMPEDLDFGPIGFGLANNMSDMTIDEPAKRLFSKQASMSAQQLANAMKSGQLPYDGDLQKKLREQQLIGGMGGPVVGFPEEAHKPFRCPVIGCEKAYKNQNGLKYHKQHGHNNQKLQENADGTFSIVDPITSIPYPGTIGMEKEKPYRCEVCGKRYKNLNGLKYHRQHSPPCNPELQRAGNPLAGLNPNANVAGNLF